MRNYKIKLIVITLVTMLVFLSPISFVTAAVSTPKASTEEETLYVGGKSFTIKIKNLVKNATVTYRSSDKKIATVSKKGVVKPLAKGTVTIYITIQQSKKTYDSKIKINIKDKSSYKGKAVAKWKDGKKDYVYFGSYPQVEVEETPELKNASYDKGFTILDGVKYECVYNSSSDTYQYFRYEPILWRVLSNEDNEVFLLSEYCLDNYYYATKYIKQSELSWSNSSVREWLNNRFFQFAFTSSEQKAINTSTVTNYFDGKLHIKQQETTFDKVFLLSLDELTKDKYNLMKITEWKLGKPYVKADNGYTSATEYADYKGVTQKIVNENEGPRASYLLRTMHTELNKYSNNPQVMIVWHSSWTVESYTGSHGIRPAIKINKAAIE